MAGKSPRKNPESGRRGQIIGILNVGDDIRCLPKRVGSDLPQADGPVALAGAGHADDVEFDVTAQRVPVERMSHSPPDLIERGWGFGRVAIEIHRVPPSAVPTRPWRRTVLRGYCWSGYG